MFLLIKIQLLRSSEAGKYVAAVLLKSGTVVATSNAVPVVLETEVDKPILTVNGNVFEGDKTVSLNVSKNRFNSFRKRHDKSLCS